MKLLIAVLALVALAGCGKRSESTAGGVDTSWVVPAERFAVVRIRGCEYVTYKYRYALTHMGDCDNPIHKEARP